MTDVLFKLYDVIIISMNDDVTENYWLVICRPTYVIIRHNHNAPAILTVTAVTAYVHECSKMIPIFTDRANGP